MNRRGMIWLLAAGLALSGAKTSAAEIGTVRLKGYLGERLDAMIKRHVCVRREVNCGIISGEGRKAKHVYAR